MKMKKAAGILLSAILAIGVLGGCGKDVAQEKPREPERGRYVQLDCPLPEEWANQTVKQIFTSEDKVHVLTAMQQEENTFLQEWELQEETFTEVTGEWLASLAIPCETWVDMQLMQDEDNQYLYVRLVNDGHYEGHLWKEESGDAVEITPQKWTVPDETYGSYEYILGIGLLPDGMLAAVTYLSVDIINGEDGNILNSHNVTMGYGEMVITDATSLYLSTTGNDGRIGGLEKWSGETLENVETISLPVKSVIQFCALEDGTLVMAADEGIFRYNIVSETWDKLMEGSETDFALTTSWCVGLTALTDGRIYALFRHENGSTSLVWYQYDPNAVIEVTEELTLYTVIENPMLQQAAVLYHRAHPEVLITVEYVYEQYYRGEPDYEQVYQTLNTSLMGEDAPDILVMDHLKYEAYSEKGLLVDISDIVDPMEESGELMSNITGVYAQEDGKRYVVPLQFGFPLALGRDIPADDMASLERLSAFLAGKQDSYFGELTVNELVDQFYPYFAGKIVADGELDREALSQTLKQLKDVADNSGILVTRDRDDFRHNIWDIPFQSKLNIETVDGFWDCMLPMAMREYIQGEFSGFEKCFVPHMMIGVNARSSYLDTAKDFIRFALSEEAQNSEFYNGFPVNKSAFDALAAADRSDLAMETALITEDGGMETFQILDYSQEIAKELAEICKGLNRPAVEDVKIREELIDALPGYLSGSKSLEETLDTIEGGLRMYLAE